MQPKISIVTPSFNSGAFIEQAILSVLEQDYNNIEYFVIDGGSTDETVDILKKYSSKANYKNKFNWISEPDEGQTDAINKGLKLCSGDWFAWLNADDYYEPNIFSRIGPELSSNIDKGVIYGNCYNQYDYLSNNKKHLYKHPANISFNSMSRGNVVFGPASFYNMKHLKKIGEFNTDIHYWMDYDMYLKLIKISRFHYIDIDITTFRIHNNQKSMSDYKLNEYMDYQKEAYKIWRKNGGSISTLLFFRQFKFFIKLVFLKNRLFGNKHYSIVTSR